VQEYAKARAVLEPHGVTLAEAIQYYEGHVLRYQKAPIISKIVEQMLKEAESNKRRDRTVADIRNRLTNFAVDFGNRKLTDLTVQEIKEWVADEDWAAQTRINYLTTESGFKTFIVPCQSPEVGRLGEGAFDPPSVVAGGQNRDLLR
jgi:hypothetical protein